MEMTIDDARSYIAKVTWQFAKTMPQWPHEYTVRQWRLDLEPEFFALVALIRREGITKPWPPEAAQPRDRHTYLELDGLGLLDHGSAGSGDDSDQPGAGRGAAARPGRCASGLRTFLGGAPTGALARAVAAHLRAQSAPERNWLRAPAGYLLPTRRTGQRGPTALASRPSAVISSVPSHSASATYQAS